MRSQQLELCGCEQVLEMKTLAGSFVENLLKISIGTSICNNLYGIHSGNREEIPSFAFMVLGSVLNVWKPNSGFGSF